MKIITSHDYPPIPDRSMDWSARLDGYDGAPDAGTVGNWTGHGASKREAVTDLLDQIYVWIEEQIEAGEEVDL